MFNHKYLLGLGAFVAAAAAQLGLAGESSCCAKRDTDKAPKCCVDKADCCKKEQPNCCEKKDPKCCVPKTNGKKAAQENGTTDGSL